MKNKILFFLIGVIVIGMGTTSRADLILRGEDNLGHNLVYDTDLDITWYDFSLFAPEYQDAVVWADQLSVRVGTTEFTDWRLPSLLEVKDSNYGDTLKTCQEGFTGLFKKKTSMVWEAKIAGKLRHIALLTECWNLYPFPG